MKQAEDISEAEFQRQMKIVRELHGCLVMPLQDIIDKLRISIDPIYIKARLHIHFQTHPYYKRA